MCFWLYNVVIVCKLMSVQAQHHIMVALAPLDLEQEQNWCSANVRVERYMTSDHITQ